MKLLSKIIDDLIEKPRPLKTAIKPEDYRLLEDFQKWIISSERFTAEPWRRKGMRFYPSGFAYNCDRSMALDFVLAPESETFKDARLEVTFALGNGIHEVLQAMFRKYAESRGWSFEDEVRIKPEENKWFISGRVDGIFKTNDGQGDRCVEIKSINDAGFQRLHSSATEPHMEQNNIYVGLKNLSCGHVLYVNKDKSTFKEFIYPLNAGMFRQTMLRVETILTTMQKNAFPTCMKCTKSCKFFGINKTKPDATPKDFADEACITAIGNFNPIYLKRQ